MSTGQLSYSAERESLFKHNVESVLPVTHWMQGRVKLPEQARLTLSQTNELEKCLPVAGDSRPPFNLDAFSKWVKFHCREVALTE